MNTKTKKILKITAIGLALIFTLSAAYFIYAIFINPLWEVKIEGDVSSEEKEKLPKVIKLSESDFREKLNDKSARYYLVQFWCLGISCSEQFDSSFVNNLRRYSELRYLLISFNLNAKNYDLIIGSYLKDKGISINTYQINKKVNIFNLKNDSNLSEFQQHVFINYQNTNSLLFLIDSTGNIINDFPDLVNSPTKYDVLVRRFDYIYSILNRYLKSES